MEDILCKTKFHLDINILNVSRKKSQQKINS